MHIYHAPVNALRAHMIHINLNTIFYTHVEHSPTKTISIKYSVEKHAHTHTHTHTLTHTLTHSHTHTHTHSHTHTHTHTHTHILTGTQATNTHTRTHTHTHTHTALNSNISDTDLYAQACLSFHSLTRCAVQAVSADSRRQHDMPH